MFVCFLIMEEGEVKEFAIGTKRLEEAFDFINHFVAMEYQILSLTLLEYDGRKTQLPVEAFNGELYSDQLKCLQKEWEAILYIH